MTKHDPNTPNDDILVEQIEKHLDDLDDDIGIAEGTIAMVPSSVIAAITNFVVDNFGECALNTFMDYFPINASALLADEPMFKMGGIELVFDKPFNDFVHLLSHLHPDFVKVMDAAAMEAADQPNEMDMPASH